MSNYGFIHGYPYTNFHELNLDYILSEVERIAKDNGVIIEDIKSLKQQANTFDEFMNAMISGDFPDSFKEALTEWIQENAIDIIGDSIKFVTFGLTQDGYFVAYIPDSWNGLDFGTSGYDIYPENVDFGHLTLSY